MGDEIVVTWKGNVSSVRNAVQEFENMIGKKVIFPVYFKNKVMTLSSNGGVEVENNSEIYFYEEDGIPVMEVAMPISHRNLRINLNDGTTME